MTKIDRESIEISMKQLIDSLNMRISELPVFIPLTPPEVKPQNVIVKLLECSTSMGQVSDVLSQIPVIRTQVRHLKKAATAAFVAIPDDEFITIEEDLRGLEQHLEVRIRSLSTHLTVLRGLSTSLRSGSMMDLVPAVDGESQ